MKRKSLYYLVLAALLAALTAALTAVQILRQPNGEYVHLGDLFVFLSGCLLPTPYAMAAAAIGGGLADLFGGAAYWAPATIVIKAAIAGLLSAKRDRLLTRRNALMTLPYAAITLAGYALYNLLLVTLGLEPGEGTWAAILLASVSFNTLQVIASSLLFFALAAALDRIGFKQKLMRWEK